MRLEGKLLRENYRQHSKADIWVYLSKGIKCIMAVILRGGGTALEIISTCSKVQTTNCNSGTELSFFHGIHKEILNNGVISASV